MPGLRASLIASLFAVSFALVTPGRARAQSELDQAYAAYLEADFDAARRHLDAGMALARASHAELARGHALAAVLASLDEARAGEVTGEIEAALALDASVAVPEGAPRSVSERFATARAERAGTEPGVLVTSEGAGASRSVVASPRDVPASLVGSVHLRCGSLEASDPRAPRLMVGGDAVSCDGQLRGPDDRLLFERTLALEEDPTSGGGDEGWIVLGVVLGVAAVGAAVAVGVVVGTSGDPGIGAPMVIGW